MLPTYQTPLVARWQSPIHRNPVKRVGAKLERSPKQLGQLDAESGESSNDTRAAHFGIFIGGMAIGLVAWHWKDTAIGMLILGAAASAAGVGIAFFLMDVLGTRPVSST